MTEPITPSHAKADELWRWLVGGLAFGGVLLGLLIAAYAVGYHRGHDHARTAVAPPPATTSPATTNAATTAALSPASGPIPVTAALVTRGKMLFRSDGCAGCHSLTGTAGAGPSVKALAGSSVALTTGRTVTADDAYLERAIADPDAQIVKGYSSGIMSAAVSSFDLAKNPDDIRALAAFIKSQK